MIQKNDNPLGYLILRLRFGDEKAWMYVKSRFSTMLNTVIVNDLLKNDLPFSLQPQIYKTMWNRAQVRINALQEKPGDTEVILFEWLQIIQRERQAELVEIYHDMSNPDFITCLSQPTSEAGQEMYQWAWQRVVRVYSRPLNQTIRSVLSSRVEFDEHDINDIWQEAYHTIQRKISDFVPTDEDSLLKWMSAHVRYAALNFYRKYLSKNPLPLETVDYYKGTDFEDPFDNDAKARQDLRRAYYDVLIEIVTNLHNDPVSSSMNLADQREAIMMLFQGNFDKPLAVASKLGVEVREINNLQRNVKRRFKGNDPLAAMLG
ncbi:MAG: hypothetical protein AAFR81_10445 [Chloroflexota bacterium]